MLTKINKRIKRRQGFTLVELLLVVAILAILAFLAVPAIASTIRNARNRTCASNEIMLEQAIYRWYADQVSAGRILNFGELTVTIEDEDVIYDLYVSEWDDEMGDISANDLDTLASYLTPASRWPECPFSSDNSYLVRIIIGEGGGLEGVRVFCDHEGVAHERLRAFDGDPLLPPG